MKNFERLKKLLSEGESFNYKNFAHMSKHGYPAAFRNEYTAWTLKVESIIDELTKKDSIEKKRLEEAKKITVVEYGEEKYLQYHSAYMGTLISTIDILSFNADYYTVNENKLINNDRIFIVHGQDDDLKHTTEIFIREIGLEPIVLHRQLDKGQTIIEKFENNSDVGYAIVLLTPDDICINNGNQEYRARQNVVYELGYFTGKLGRERVCCIYKENVILPTDISGVVYKKITKDITEKGYELIKELKALGYKTNV